MKKLKRVIIICLSLSIVFLGESCKKFIDKPPFGSLNETNLATSDGVNQLLIGAYTGLRQYGLWPGNTYYSAPNLYILSGIASDEAHEGSMTLPPLAEIENYSLTSVNQVIETKWGNLYSAIQRCNDVLRVLPKVGDLTTDQATQIEAEAKFLRAYFHFVAVKIWGDYVPYVTDSIEYNNNNYIVSNENSAWPDIENDFKFAMDNLSEIKSDVGRANKWAAASFLATAYMAEHKFSEAGKLLTEIIDEGVNPSGDRYSLVKFRDNFSNTNENNAESIFAVQFTADGHGANANEGNVLTQPTVPGFAGGGNQCPSFSLANSYKTDPQTGLPLIYNFNDEDMKNDQGIPSDEPFVPYAGTVDPRLDLTIARRGLPTLDWGIFNPNFLYSQRIGGPYHSLKTLIAKDQVAGNTTSIGWILVTNINVELMRFSRVLLLAAEAEIENGDLEKAQEYVNRVRARAADQFNWVTTYVDNNDPSKGFTSNFAANYKIGLYPDGYFASKGADFSRDAVRFEEKIELALEGDRFFDLRRWDNGTGSMATTINDYLYHETHIATFDYSNCIGAKFVQGKDEVFPIPQQEIDRSVKAGGKILKQNPNW